ncbi:MAG: hypothetical protein JRM99_02315 [Nitrososphaerota archaeon]|nr:hypothetical protein [Nitrososphaerota archaeon]
MSRICVTTSKARAYYALVSRLRKAGLPFSSAVPESDFGECDVVLTTEDESERFGDKALLLERLDEDPGVFKGQVVSRLGGEEDLILVGIDPGKRTGLAVFYGRTKLSSNTFDSIAALCSRVAAYARAMPTSRIVVRIGNGNRVMAEELADHVGTEVPAATVELVDESGTSLRSSKMKGVQRDQAAAAKIAFRKGEAVSPPTRSQS